MDSTLNDKINGLLAKKESIHKQFINTLSAADTIHLLKSKYSGSTNEINTVYKLLAKDADNYLKQEETLEEVINFLIDSEEENKPRMLFEIKAKILEGAGA